MKRLLAAWLLALCATLPAAAGLLALCATLPAAAGLLALCATLPAAAGPSAPASTAGQAEAAASRRLLVMLRLPPQHYHPDAAYAGRYPNDSGRAARRRAAADLARAHGLMLIDDWPMPVIGVDCYVMEQPAGEPPERALAALAADPRVMWAQPMHTFHGLDAGDPLYAAQPAARYWHLAELHRASTGRGVRVAVVDSGIDGSNPDLAGQLQLRANFVDGSADAAEAHGTAVAGIIAARAGNGAGIAGVAPDARLLALRACWPEAAGATRCNSFTLGKALNFAILNGAKIINLSLSGPPDRLLQALLDVAAARGMAVVSAADPAQADGGFPASWPGVIAVGAMGGGATNGGAMGGGATGSGATGGGATGGGATGSGATGSAALLAPGTDIPTTAPGARWAFVSGPSYAAAHVAGLAALLAQLRPAANGAELRRAIVTSDAAARNWTVATADPAAHAGNIDACASIARITGACACSCTSLAAMKVIGPLAAPHASH